MLKEKNRKVLGIEFGSTRIKAVLIDNTFKELASGSHEWENQLVDGYWTYSLEDIWAGLQDAYKKLADNYNKTTNETLSQIDAIGISGMMHGYLPFDEEENLLVPFRTWRNTSTKEAADKLSELFSFNIPQRWSIAHLYQAVLNKESHVKEIDYITTLAGYIHWKLTGEKVVGIGEAAGMFPIDSKKANYNSEMVRQFGQLIEGYSFDWKLDNILPAVKIAGENGGYLSDEGAKLLDPSGSLEAGIPLAPPEGDAGTGMVATNSVAQRTGNISAGTSIFSMIVLEEELKDYYVEIDIVTTPAGKPTAMVHCNNFTTDINRWVNLFKEVINSVGYEVSSDKLFSVLFNKALEADDDGGMLMSSNYYSGEPITGFEEGRPLFIQMPDSHLSLPNFMQTQIYSAMATLKIGMDILIKKENVTVNEILGHGGFFRTKNVGQQMMADALRIPVSVMDSASEGGAWGMAILASFVINRKQTDTLEDFISNEVFKNEEVIRVAPTEKGTKKFEEFLKRYEDMLLVEKAAIKYIN